MTLKPSELNHFVATLDERARQSEQLLNTADARIGDGDTGSMLCRVISAIAKAPLVEADSLSSWAKLAAQAAMKETGSSLGTLIATGLLTFAKEAQNRGEKISPENMAVVISSIGAAISSRGKAVPGNKTVVDSLNAVANALEAGPATLETAKKGAVEALEKFRERPCKIGRARMFPQRSTGADDPGMLAAALLLGSPFDDHASHISALENHS